MLPATDRDAAAAIAEHCRQQVLDARIAHPGAGTGDRLTVSVGVGTTVPEPGADPLEFIESVDRRLYQAKLGGRNRVVGEPAAAAGDPADRSVELAH